MPRDRVTELLAGVLAVLMVVGVLVAVGAVPARHREAPARAGSSNASGNPSPGTSRPSPRAGPSVLAVKVDNVAAARPPVGIGVADMVYVEPVEGGLNRLIAVFGSREPPVVGPVRSARRTDLQLLAQFGRPTLAFSGAAPELLPRIASAPVRAAPPERFPAAYFRSGSRPAPHDLFVRPARLPPGGGWSPRARLDFGPAPPGGVAIERHRVRYGNASVAFTWSPRKQRWLVSMDGAAYFTANGSRVTAGTVVVQRVPVRESAISDSLGSPSPFASTVGGGRALVLRDGRAFEATWSRPAPGAATSYTTLSGQPIDFAPGQAWVLLVRD